MEKTALLATGLAALLDQPAASHHGLCLSREGTPVLAAAKACTVHKPGIYIKKKITTTKRSYERYLELTLCGPCLARFLQQHARGMRAELHRPVPSR